MLSESERGTSLIELTIAVAIMTFVLFGAFAIVRGLIAAQQQLAQRHADYAQIETLVSAWETESRTAEAITTPGAGRCAEVEFFARDPGGSTFHVWSYRFDPAAQTITRTASTNGAIAPCGASGGGAVVARGISAMSVSARRAGALAGAADAPYAAASVTDAAIPLGIREADGTTTVTAGNAFVEIALTGSALQRTVDLLPGIAPSGLTLALTYTCNARCAPGAPHDGARIDRCTSSYVVTAAYPTRLAFVVPPGGGDGATVAQQWSIQGTFAFAYSGADTRTLYDDFAIVVPGDSADPANGYYPAAVAPVDPVASADELVAAYGYGVFSPGVARDVGACIGLGVPAPVFAND